MQGGVPVFDADLLDAQMRSANLAFPGPRAYCHPDASDIDGLDSLYMCPPAPLEEIVFMEHGFESALKFSSAFECGNLKFATMHSDSVYELWMSNDTNSKGHTQWYYFAVAGGRRGQEVTFRISNFFKRKLLYRKGKVPFFWSEKSGRGWEQIPSGKAQYTSHTTTDRSKKWYTLSFNHTFSHGDVVFFAYGLPYSYSHQLSLMKSLSAHPLASDVTRVAKLCTSLGGHACHKVVIADKFAPASRTCLSSTMRRPSKDSLDGKTGTPPPLPLEDEKQQEDDLHGADPRKPVVVMMGRQHPGETHGSWILHGMIRFLVGDSTIAKGLRKKYNFVAIPMVNIDGVIRGNSRCSLAGVDLNRQWHSPDKSVHPIVYSVKALLKRLSTKHRVIAAIDFHGHSARRDVFFYGCPFKKPPAGEVTNDGNDKAKPKKKKKSVIDKKGSFSSEVGGEQKDVLNASSSSKLNSSSNSNDLVAVRDETTKQATDVVPVNPRPRRFRPPPHRDVTVLPRISSWLCSDFSFAKCIFDIQKYKINTARAVIYHQMGVEHCFTVEASMCGTTSYGLREHCMDLPPNRIYDKDRMETALGNSPLGYQFQQLRLATLGIAMSHALHWFFELNNVPFTFVPESAEGMDLKLEELEKEANDGKESEAGESDGGEAEKRPDSKEQNASVETEDIPEIDAGAMTAPELSKPKAPAAEPKAEPEDYSADAIHIDKDRVLGIETSSQRFMQLRKCKPYMSPCRRSPARQSIERPAKEGPLFDADDNSAVEERFPWLSLGMIGGLAGFKKEDKDESELDTGNRKSVHDVVAMLHDAILADKRAVVAGKRKGEDSASEAGAGSDSDPSADNLGQEELKKVKKKLLKIARRRKKGVSMDNLIDVEAKPKKTKPKIRKSSTATVVISSRPSIRRTRSLSVNPEVRLPAVRPPPRVTVELGMPTVNCFNSILMNGQQLTMPTLVF